MFKITPIVRIRIWYVFLLCVASIFIIRLFYLQIIQHDYYQQVALTKQLKEYEIPAARGIIEAQNGDQTLPIVLNEILYTLFADPIYIKDHSEAALKIADVIAGDSGAIQEQLKTPNTRYVILAKKLPKQTAEKIDALGIPGVGTREATYRTYPQNSLAAQLLGFVNDEGNGVYGIEEALNSVLTGTPGQVKAITDAQGVPLAGNKDNIAVAPEQGKKVVLTIDIGMQQQLEEILKTGLEEAIADTGSALVIEAKTGAIKALANFPTYNPSEYALVEDSMVFNNAAVSSPLEIGSIMKPLTVAAAIDQGLVTRDTTYYDPGSYRIGDATVKNVEIVGGVGMRSMEDILRLSLNTGVTWLLMQMGGGEINEQARLKWHEYMTDRYQLGKPTGIEQGFEASGSVPDPINGFGLNIQYANSVFGQGMTATPLQMGLALASAVNGGTYYKPSLVASVDGQAKLPEIKRQGVISPSASSDIKSLMEAAFEKNFQVYGMSTLRPEFGIGGKTGTAQVPNPEGGYYEDRYNGTFMGFVGGNEAEYIIVVRVDTPKVAGFAGSRAAGPIFGKLANMLIDNFGVTPRQ